MVMTKAIASAEAGRQGETREGRVIGGGLGRGGAGAGDGAPCTVHGTNGTYRVKASCPQGDMNSDARPGQANR